MLYKAAAQSAIGPLQLVFLALALACLACLVKALFFSLPKDTYAQPGAPRTVCRNGLYALSRHPGVLFYVLMYLFVLAAFPQAWVAACVAVLIAGDLAYMLLQDRWSFPRIFTDYEDYRRSTPLIVPTPRSLAAWRACLGSKGGSHA